MPELQEEILTLLKNRVAAKHEYINPHFLAEIVNALDKYYNIEDESVDTWIYNMYSC